MNERRDREVTGSFRGQSAKCAVIRAVKSKVSHDA